MWFGYRLSLPLWILNCIIRSMWSIPPFLILNWKLQQQVCFSSSSSFFFSLSLLGWGRGVTYTCTELLNGSCSLFVYFSTIFVLHIFCLSVKANIIKGSWILQNFMHLQDTLMLTLDPLRKLRQHRKKNLTSD